MQLNMSTTKILKSSLILILSITFFTTSQGQILKKLKRKIDQKIENKIDRKIDKVIDDALDGEIKKKEKPTNNNDQKSNRNLDKDFGDINISSKIHETIGIKKLGKVKVVQNENNYRISGSWWTHSADIPDGFTLEIKNASSLKSANNPQKTKFKIPEEATLHLAYDPSMPNLKSKINNRTQAVTDKYVSYNISQGTVSVFQLDDNTIHFGFTGENGLKGNLQGLSPDFISKHSQSNNKRSSRSVESTTSNNQPKLNSSFPSAGTFEFNYEFINKITTDKENETYTLSYLFNANEEYFGMKVDMSDLAEESMEGESIIIYDNGTSFIFVDAQGMQIQMSSASAQQQAMPSDQMANYDYSDVKKTGATKSILGYTCNEYTLTDQSNKVIMWVAPDFKIPNWFTTQQNQSNQEIDLNGYVLEYNVQSDDGNMTMKTIKINENASIKIVGSDYKKMF